MPPSLRWVRMSSWIQRLAWALGVEQLSVIVPSGFNPILHMSLVLFVSALAANVSL